MKIYAEQGYYPTCHFLTYEQKRTWSRKERRHDLNQLLIDNQYTQDPHIFLLDEKRFTYFQFFIHFQTKTKVTRFDIEKIMQEKLTQIGDKTSGYSMLFYTIDSIYVDGEESAYLLAKKGTIFFNLAFVFIDNRTKDLFTKRGWNYQKSKNIHIIPKSYYTIKFLKEKLHKRNFQLLFLGDHDSTIVSVQNGFYAAMDKVNRGNDMLKRIYKDNNISQYFCNTTNTNIPHLAQQTIDQSLDFFTKMLAKRLKSQIGTENDLILVSDLTHNGQFQEKFAKRYNEYINGYIVPFTHSKNLETYNTKRKRDEMNILTTLHYHVK